MNDSVKLEIQNHGSLPVILYLDGLQITGELVNGLDSSSYSRRISLDRKFLSPSIRIFSNKKGTIKVDFLTSAVIANHEENSRYGEGYVYNISEYLTHNKKIIPSKSTIELYVPLKFDVKYVPRYELKHSKKYWMRLVYNGELIEYVCKKELNKIFQCDKNTLFQNLESNVIKIRFN